MKRILIVLMSAITAFFLAAGTATATEAGTWRAYGNTNPITSSPSTWHCGSTTTIATDVVGQSCAIRSASGSGVQAAVIVRNNRSSLYSAQAAMDLYTAGGTYLGDWVCPSSGVGANSWSVCFGRTLAVSSSVNSVGAVNGVSLPISPYV